VALAVVDTLQPVDIDERHDQASVGSLCAIDFLLKYSRARSAALDASQVVAVRIVELAQRLLAITRGPLPIRRCVGPVGGRSRPVGSRTVADRRRGPTTCTAGPFKLCSSAIACVCSLVAGFGGQVTHPRRLVTQRGNAGAIERCLRPPGGGGLAPQGAFLAVYTRAFMLSLGYRVRAIIGRKVAIGRSLISVGSDLVGFSLRLVELRRGLVTVRSTLICVGGCLVKIRSALIAFE
jgi:hypothetical protein